MRHNPRWAAEKPDPITWKPRAGRPRSEIAAEQDDAAGGRLRRKVQLGDKTATASIELKDLGGRRVYAYLRYQDGGRTTNVYVGEAPGASRHARLVAAWKLVRTRGLLEPED